MSFDIFKLIISVYKRPARIQIKSFFSSYSKFTQTVSFSQYNRFNIYQSLTMQQNHLSLTMVCGSNYEKYSSRNFKIRCSTNSQISMVGSQLHYWIFLYLSNFILFAFTCFIRSCHRFVDHGTTDRTRIFSVRGSLDVCVIPYFQRCSWSWYYLHW